MRWLLAKEIDDIVVTFIYDFGLHIVEVIINARSCGTDIADNHRISSSDFDVNIVEIVLTLNWEIFGWSAIISRRLKCDFSSNFTIRCNDQVQAKEDLA